MSQMNTPGVYIEEISMFPGSVKSKETAIPVFIGYTEKAMDKREPFPSQTINDIRVYNPVKIHSLFDYENYFGTGPDEEGTIHTLHAHMQLFFANGGGKCYIISVGNTTAPTIEKNALLAGLTASLAVEEITLTVLPQVCSLPRANDALEVYSTALLQAASTEKRFVIIDCYNNDPESIRALKLSPDLPAAVRRFGAAYHPYIQTKLSGATATLPPCAAIAGVYVHTDNTRGVWKAPANVTLKKVMALTEQITDEQQAGPMFTELSVNPIRSFEDNGSQVWGARTLAADKYANVTPERGYVPLVRTLSFIQSESKDACAALVFEPNDTGTWNKCASLLENYLIRLWKDGALQGTKPEQAFFVKVGLGTTMTANDIHEGNMIIETGVALLKPAEFSIIHFTLKMRSR